MTKACDIIKTKSILSGNNVSHSNRKTRRRFIPNLHKKTLFSKVLRRKVNLKLAVSTLRSIETVGGLDEYLSKAPIRILTDKAMSLKTQIAKKSRKQAAQS